nr:hypothetical protein [Bacillus sp. Marseille-Q3570]
MDDHPNAAKLKGGYFLLSGKDNNVTINNPNVIIRLIASNAVNGCTPFLDCLRRGSAFHPRVSSIALLLLYHDSIIFLIVNLS